MSEIHGYWHKTARRCDYCHKPRKEVFVVTSGDCKGVFCSRLHYQLASERMKNENSQTK